MLDLTSLINESLSREMQSLLYLLGSWGEKTSYQVFAAGEFVLELLRGEEKRRIDLVVVDSAVEFGQSVTRILPGKLESYEILGTATLKLPGDIVVNMVSAQKDIFSASGKDDLIENALKNELYKRDFTIYTMACALNHCRYGKLYDFFGGKKDFQQGIIKILYRLSFVDNPLRILKAVRLEQRLGFVMEKETFLHLESALKKKLLERASREQISAEIRAIFKEPSPAGILQRLQELGIFKRLFPRIDYNPELNDRLLRAGNILKRLEQGNYITGYNTFNLYLSALFRDLSSHDVKYLSYLLRLKKGQYLTICSIIKNSFLLLNEIKKGGSKAFLYSSSNFNKAPRESLVLTYILADDYHILEEDVVKQLETL